jgi:threonine/homoserine/homoserine lactone efflux protein
MTERAVALVLFLFPLAWSPGPGNMFFAALGARFGVRATLPASLGYHLATLVVTVVIGLGFSTATARFGGVFDLIRFAGAGYVLWLATRLWQAGAAGSCEAARPAGFVDGAVLLLLNPKAYVIIVLMFTQFLPPQAPGSVAAAISVIFTLNNLVAFTAWTLLGDGLIRLFASERSARGMNRLFAAILAGVAIWMAVQ